MLESEFVKWFKFVFQIAVLWAGLLAFSNPARAQSGATARVFVLTSTYGVMAGSLTGLASLAFYEAPSENLRNVAMGASIGLYVGLLLGTYIVFFGPSSKAAHLDNGNSSLAMATGIYPLFDERGRMGLGWQRSF